MVISRTRETKNMARYRAIMTRATVRSGGYSVISSAASSYRWLASSFSMLWVASVSLLGSSGGLSVVIDAIFRNLM